MCSVEMQNELIPFEYYLNLRVFCSKGLCRGVQPRKSGRGKNYNYIYKNINFCIIIMTINKFFIFPLAHPRGPHPEHRSFETKIY